MTVVATKEKSRRNYHIKDLTGQTFGMLTVVRLAEEIRTERNEILYDCLCTCGNKVIRPRRRLLRVKNVNCGCLKRETLENSKVRKSLRKVYDNVLYRCYKETNISYENYGAKGTKVCEEWRKSFQSFFDWAIQNGYAKGLQLDRIDYTGDYEPSNCRWISPKQNNLNKSTNKTFTIKGMTKTYTEWAEIAGITPLTFGRRVRAGWEEERLLSPSNYKRNNINQLNEKQRIKYRLQKVLSGVKT